jgi:TusA-related sulfurtransferase
MADDRELKINARGLSVPGPRMMTITAMESNPGRRMRVVVSTLEAAEDVRQFLGKRGVIANIDQVGEEFHVITELEGQ